MFYGSLVFISTNTDIKKIENMIEGLVEGNVESLDGPFDFDTNDSSGVLYKVEFNETQWINIVELEEILHSHHIKSDIIHALTDGTTMVEVISTNPLYDNHTNNPNKMYELAALYQFKLIGDDISDDEAMGDDFDDINDFDDSDNEE